MEDGEDLGWSQTLFSSFLLFTAGGSFGVSSLNGGPVFWRITCKKTHAGRRRTRFEARTKTLVDPSGKKQTPCF